MLGAIVGDLVGSVYEHHNHKSKDFPLFQAGCRCTDDTVMTCAVAEAILNGGQRKDFLCAMKKYGRLYPRAGYGYRFDQWIHSDSQEPYHSYGNGSAMRVSPCGWVMDCGSYAETGCYPVRGRQLAELSAAVTHDHPEGIKGALAIADAIFLSRFYFGGYCHDGGAPIHHDPAQCKQKVRAFLEQTHGYDLSRTLDEIRPDYQFDVSCQGSVPQAIIAFLESTDFEDAIRNAVSLGGDSDTIAAMTGSIAEAAYGIPDWIRERTLVCLDRRLRRVVERWEREITPK